MSLGSPSPPASIRAPVDSDPLDVVVFAHVPPPFHGQSYAVQLLLERLADPPDARDRPIRVHHVDARLSDDIEAIGRFQPTKILRLLRYGLRAIGHRIRHGARVFYYVPAAPMRSAVYRDWIVMALCRPFFPRMVFHWEAAGLAEWLETAARPWERAITRRLLSKHAVSVVLANHGRRDAESLRARRTLVVPNGLPDPCPDYASRLAPRRETRRRQLSAAGSTSADATPLLFRALYLSLCVPEKGLFDAVEAVALANARFAERRSCIRIQLHVAGKFWRDEDRIRFEKRCAEPDLTIAGPSQAATADGTSALAVVYRGFVAREAKTELFEGSDAFLFPTYYSAESFGLALAEAMAYGLPCIATRFRHVPEMLPEGYAFLVEPKSPEQIAAALMDLARGAEAPSLREHYLRRFTDLAYGRGLRAALIAAADDDHS